MQDQYARTQIVLGANAMEKLASSRVAVFGVGGVGGYAIESLARSGVGHFDIIDDDRICLTIFEQTNSQNYFSSLFSINFFLYSFIFNTMKLLNS